MPSSLLSSYPMALFGLIRDTQHFEHSQQQHRRPFVEHVPPGSVLNVLDFTSRISSRSTWFPLAGKASATAIIRSILLFYSSWFSLFSFPFLLPFFFFRTESSPFDLGSRFCNSLIPLSYLDTSTSKNSHSPSRLSYKCTI